MEIYLTVYTFFSLNFTQYPHKTKEPKSLKLRKVKCVHKYFARSSTFEYQNAGRTEYDRWYLSKYHSIILAVNRRIQEARPANSWWMPRWTAYETFEKKTNGHPNSYQCVLEVPMSTLFYFRVSGNISNKIFTLNSSPHYYSPVYFWKSGICSFILVRQ